jgi:hypothetical protein
MTMINLLCIIAGAGSGYMLGVIVEPHPVVSSPLSDILRSLAGFSGVDLTSYLTVAGLYVGIICVLFGMLWQLPYTKSQL